LKAIVHIGTEKTGTTSIQRYLYQNRAKLKGAGFYFLQSAGKRNNQALPAYCLDENRPDDYFRNQRIQTLKQRQEFKRLFIKAFDSEIRGLPRHVTTVIMSSEHFHSRIRTEAELDNLSELLTPYFDEIKIVCYLREQATTCKSYYSTHLKSGGTDSFSEFLGRCRPENVYFNYHEMLANWERGFGFESLDVSLFLQERFLNGDLLDDFTAKIDATLVGALNKPNEVENESFTPFGQALARAVNIIFPRSTVAPEEGIVRDRCKKIITQRLSGSGQLPSVEVQTSIYDSFIESNALVQRKFFPTVHSLFAPPDELVLREAVIDGVDFDTLIAVLNLIAKDAKDQFSAGDYARICTIFFSCINEITNLVTGGDDKNKRLGRTIFSEKEAYIFRDLALRAERRDVGSALTLMRLADRVGSDVPGVSEKLSEYRERIAIPRKPQFMFMFHRGDEPLDLHKKELGEKLQAWLATLPVPFGAFMTEIVSAVTLNSQGTLDDGGLLRAHSYSVIEADSLVEAHAIAQQCPLLSFGGSIDVLHLRSLGG
tara:strand:- start:4468 stop:6093 length:1626 start_codon:yes stop_codon:yes gene_type:complete